MKLFRCRYLKKASWREVEDFIEESVAQLWERHGLQYCSIVYLIDIEKRNHTFTHRTIKTKAAAFSVITKLKEQICSIENSLNNEEWE